MASDDESHRFTRERRLTFKAQVLYDKSVETYSENLRTVKKGIDSFLTSFDEERLEHFEENEISEVTQWLKSELAKYENISRQFIAFLESTRTVESASEESAHRLISSSFRSKVEYSIQQLSRMDSDKITEYRPVIKLDSYSSEEQVTCKPKAILTHRTERSQEPTDNGANEKDEKRSQTSNRSRHSKLSRLSHRTWKSGSNHSSVSSELLRQQVRLETAKIRLRYSKQEADILKKKAELEADLKIIRTEQEIDEAQSQIKVMNELLDCDEKSEHSSVSSKGIRHRTAKYVESLDNDNNKHSPTATVCDKLQNCEHDIHDVTEITVGSKKHYPTEIPLVVPQTIDHVHTSSELHINAPMFVPSDASRNLCNAFSKFMVKRDLLFSRLTKFDDKPDMFVAWKCSFKSIISEMNTTEMEEVDLLIKWLGQDSSTLALRIRAANAANPRQCLQRIWERLEDRFGTPELVEETLKRRITSFTKLTVKDKGQLFELSDLVAEIEAVMAMEQYKTVFAHYNSSSGVNPIVSKLPTSLQDKWTTEANRYKKNNGAIFPPFSVFSKFIHDMAKLRNDPSFNYEISDATTSSRKDFRTRPPGNHSLQISSRKTDASVSAPQEYNKSYVCPVHGTNHTLNMCRGFRSKPISERREFLKKNGLCFRCCGPRKHISKTCRETIKCLVCNSNRHSTALHVDTTEYDNSKSLSHYEEEATKTVNTTCTQICGNLVGYSKSCAKIVLVRTYPYGRPDQSRTLYCLIDDQSNRSLATSSFFDAFSENGPPIEYVLSSCSGKYTTAGRRATGYVVEAFDKGFSLSLPELIECDEIPNNHDEIPSPELARLFPHLQDIAGYLPAVDNDINVELLIGRDLISVHHVLDQRIGLNGLPYGQKLSLGWVIIGETCLGKVHQPTVVNSYKTSVMVNGRVTLFKPCETHINIKSDPLFLKTDHDEKLGYSVEDTEFLKLMEIGFVKDEQDQWTAPLPFRTGRPALASNRELALRRARSLDTSLQRDILKCEQITEFMQKMIDNKHAEVAPQLNSETEHWYLPIFPVYNPKKPDSVRMVFDSSAKYNGQSLNDSLLKGPDLTNSLLGVLIRFRKEAIAVTTDVEQMFYNFKVREDHRNYLRFIWHENNDINRPFIDYRMTVHVFGNRPSPAVATYGFRKTVENADQDVIDFINDSFYVDDGLISCCDVQEATSLIKRSQRALYENGHLRLHKIASNSKLVLNEFDSTDLAKNLKDLNLGSDELPLQRSLGLSWNISTDKIIFNVNPGMKPFTRRGVLSTINSLFDPIGFASPVVIRGKLLLREMLSSSKPIDWDDPLSEAYLQRWESWVTSLKDLEKLRIPRMYSDISYRNATNREIHIFSDASKEAIGAVAYIKLYDANCSRTSFLLGKAKVAPTSGHTIPRLELCAAVMAVELAEIVKEHLNFSTKAIYFYTDSQVVLGYISNETRRFHVYVSNRVSRIRYSSEPGQWQYVQTDKNPADLATRSIDAKRLPDSVWIHGPAFLQGEKLPDHENFPLINPEFDHEIRSEIQILKVNVCDQVLGSQRFSRFSEWRKLVSAISILRNFIRNRNSKNDEILDYAVRLNETELVILKEVQYEAFFEEIMCIQGGKQLPRNSNILSLCPFLDENKILRVGGRLAKYENSDAFKKPIILPKAHHVSILLIRYIHEKVRHQGRLFTEGALRDAGYWLIGAKRLINSVLRKCVVCKKLRGKFCSQQMADLPSDRLKPSPAFTFVGVDTFGPWPIIYRRTRGGQANQKRWALLFTCLVTRAVHIEVIEELTSSSFINALRRFVSLRGHVQQFRSDRGTNFVGATEDMLITSKFVESDLVKTFLSENGVSWLFNPPHASHWRF